MELQFGKDDEPWLVENEAQLNAALELAQVDQRTRRNLNLRFGDHRKPLPPCPTDAAPIGCCEGKNAQGEKQSPQRSTKHQIRTM